uniref:Uncharacterized protein n=1 Tax=Glossina palpalis gambiensis TaxID=67801 RepID=A0A1B0BZX5_9MUSC
MASMWKHFKLILRRMQVYCSSFTWSFVVIFDLPTVVSSMLSNNKAMATITNTKRLEPRHCIIQFLKAAHDPAARGNRGRTGRGDGNA